MNAYRADVPIRAGSWRAPLPTVAGEETEVVVAFADFEATSRGRAVPGAPALDAHPERIDQLGFLLADKRPGDFSLEVVSIELVGERRARGADLSPVVRTLTQAVLTGVPLFNAGDEQGCRDLYRTALLNVGSSEALTDGEARLVRDALLAARTEEPPTAAWTLRAAIDAVLASTVPSSG